MNLSREALIARADSYEHWIWFCAFLVFFGVAMEVRDAYLEHHGHVPKGVYRKVFPAALVAVGVFGEFFLGILMARAQQAIRHIDDLAVAQAQEDVAQAETDASEAKRRLHLTELKLLETQRGMLPRSLSLNFRKFSAHLSSGKIGPPFENRIFFFYKEHDSEAEDLAGFVAMAISTSKWMMEDPRPIPHPSSVMPTYPLREDIVTKLLPTVLITKFPGMSFERSIFGIFPGSVCVLSRNGPEKNRQQKAIVDGLNESGIAAFASFNPDLPENQIVVYVGQKFGLKVAKEKPKLRKAR